jgi:cyclopropane fatty-acyl-phospholipid synthase-like methyltransferase
MGVDPPHGGRRSDSPRTAGYAFDDAAIETNARFEALEHTYDRATRFNLETIGVSPGARCWEIGCGAGSIASWLAGATGLTGYVLATDLDRPGSRRSRPGFKSFAMTGSATRHRWSRSTWCTPAWCC